jgi:hypothetical protein
MGSPVADNTIDPGADAEVIVELEAGSAVYGMAAQWHVGVTIKDLEGGVIPFTLAPTATLTGSLLLIGTTAANYDATFVEGTPFLILP